MTSPATVAPDLESAQVIAHELMQLVRLVQRASTAHGRADDLDRASYAVLGHVVADGPQRAVDIAEAVCADPSTVSRRVSALVADGLLERRADPADGRASLLAVTTAGRARLEAGRAHKAEVIARTIGHWDPADRRRLAELLHRFRSDLTTGLSSGLGTAPTTAPTETA